jgi:uncharacterized repeat protein (TIGR03803 family)
MRHFYFPGLLILIACCFVTPTLSQGHLWGTAARGGVDGAGVIFRTDADGTGYTVVKEFNVTHAGEKPRHTALLLAGNGKLYGLTSAGGRYNAGVLFEFDPAAGTYEKKIEFDPNTTGGSPVGSLVEIAGGKLYGVTAYGGLNNAGVIFEFDPADGSFAKKIDLSDELGKYPFGGLALTPTGKLYGMTRNGGGAGDGVLFEFDPATARYTPLWSFHRETIGAQPIGTLTLASGGIFYGLTTTGGVNDNGTLFSFDPATYAFRKRVDFSSIATGSMPAGSLIEGAGGKLYGMTTTGGIYETFINRDGTLFEYDTATDVVEKKIDFNVTAIGSFPYGSLLRASNGTFYGMTSYGGPGVGVYEGLGVLFAYTPEDGLVVKHRFEYETGGIPYGSLTEVNGKLYGMNFYGGLANGGTIFEFDLATETYTKKVDLGFAQEGAYPMVTVAPVQGKLFGVTQGGGTFGQGTIFEYDTATGDFLKRFEFSENRDAMFAPAGKLVLAANGKLYGVTTQTPQHGTGALFEFDPVTGTVTKKLDFESNPARYLTLASNGKLYGLTRADGVENSGRLFVYDPQTDAASYVVDFKNAITGSDPEGTLMESNGILYGITAHGGESNLGTIYSFNLASGVLQAQYHFTRISNSTQEVYGLTEGLDKKLYGTAQLWQGDQVAVIFQFDPARKSFSVVHEFTMLNGGLPNRGRLTLLPDGTLTGLTAYGGIHDTGVLFRFDPQTSAYTVRHDFDAGTVVDQSELTFVPGLPVITGANDDAGRNAGVYPNPTADRVYLDAAVGEVREIRVVDAGAATTVVPFVKADGRYEVDVQRLASGFYILEVYTRKEVRKVKVVKR